MKTLQKGIYNNVENANMFVSKMNIKNNNIFMSTSQTKLKSSENKNVLLALTWHISGGNFKW